jgi:hypothetical protein
MEPRAIEGKIVGYPDDAGGAYTIKHMSLHNQFSGPQRWLQNILSYW